MLSSHLLSGTLQSWQPPAEKGLLVPRKGNGKPPLKTEQQHSQCSSVSRPSLKYSCKIIEV